MPILDVSAQVSNLPLGYMNYDQIAKNSGQFLTDIFWDVDFREPAPAVYFPGKDFLRCRITGCNCQVEDGEIGNLTASIRGFKVMAPNPGGEHGGTFTLQLQDFDDQSLMTWLWDWYCKANDPKNNYRFPQNDVKAPLVVITQYNNQRIPVKVYTYKGVFPNSVGDWKDFQGKSGEAGDAGQFSVTFQAENATLKLLTTVE